jgi:ribosomal protein S18 acetylase RimI-like enzyme
LAARLAIRPIRPSEHDPAGRLVVSAYRALPGAHTTAEYELELSDVSRRAAEAEVLVAVDGPDLVGCVTFVPDPGNPWAERLEDGESSIRMLAVDPGLQGRGAGRSLLEACVQRSLAIGSAGLFLHSTPWMATAHRLYMRSGFVRVPERDWLPVPDVPLLAFRLDLLDTASVAT